MSHNFFHNTKKTDFIQLILSSKQTTSNSIIIFIDKSLAMSMGIFSCENSQETTIKAEPFREEA